MKEPQTKGIYQEMKGVTGGGRGPPGGWAPYLLLLTALQVQAKVTAGRKRRQGDVNSREGGTIISASRGPDRSTQNH